MSSVTVSPSEELAKSLIKCHTKEDSLWIHLGCLMIHGEYFKDIVERFRGFNWTHFENTLEISLV